MIIVDSMGHLYSTESLKEIYDFAVNKMGLKPEWNHLGNLFPHWDLTTKRKQKQAIELGATFMDARDSIELGNYKLCKTWFIQLAKEEHANDNKFFYECTGLVGQRIHRIDYSKLKHRLV